MPTPTSPCLPPAGRMALPSGTWRTSSTASASGLTTCCRSSGGGCYGEMRISKRSHPRELPEIRYFDRMGFVTMRSGWDKDATMAHFQCGPFEIWDGRWGRNNADNNSFLIISRGGCMAADTGTRWGNGEGLGGHMQMYFRQTVAHNSVTVGDEDVKTPDGDAVRGGPGGPDSARVVRPLGRQGPAVFQ